MTKYMQIDIENENARETTTFNERFLNHLSCIFYLL